MITNHIPKRICVYNGVAVRDLPIYNNDDVRKRHKQLLCQTVSEVVAPKDSVVEVGAGRGLATVHAARAGGTVVTYEAASDMVQTCRETATINCVDVTVNHAIIGPVHDAYGDTENADVISPNKIDTDVLILDCEGAETDILPSAEFKKAVVETHPEFGADTDTVLSILESGRVVGEDPHDGHVVVTQ